MQVSPVVRRLPVVWVVALAGCSGATTAYRARSATAPASYSRQGAGGDGEAAAPADIPEAGARADAVPAPDRPGLGTEFGEAVSSSVVEQPFERASDTPFAAVMIHYNDAEGVAAQADSRGAALGPVEADTPAGGLAISLTDDDGRPLPGYAAPGRTYVVGQTGQRYLIHIENRTAGRYEVVASVDGLDVIDGREASYGKRGYIVPPASSLTIQGFRTSADTVAAFRFAAVRDSYASRTGNDRNVGVVGLAFFAEQGSTWTTDEVERRETADPFPGRYASPPPR